ncbi:hypothetical protein HGM15179_014894 [Zosterops borbonicus]|uniref:Uncharacterized protein n=1 Tax=Zosterops borbonicus TaxID=364589 RepID=A0A8K1LFL5_9PASS|nr:hypothetical protein HGM15179_014894 [Zosterops borbonicus]
MPSTYQGEEPLLISEMTEGSQQVIALEAEMNLTRTTWQKHPLVTSLKAAVSFAMPSSEQGTPRIRKGMAVMPVEEQQIPVVTVTESKQQYCP